MHCSGLYIIRFDVGNFDLSARANTACSGNLIGPGLFIQLSVTEQLRQCNVMLTAVTLYSPLPIPTHADRNGL